MIRSKLEIYISRTLLGLAALAFLLILIPLNILNNWKLTTDRGTYRINEKVSLVSVYDKKYDVKGASNRYLECETKTGKVKYPIFYSFSGQGSGHQEIESTVTIPEIEQKLPVKCHIRIDLLYVLGIKPITQTNISNDFWVLPK